MLWLSKILTIYSLRIPVLLNRTFNKKALTLSCLKMILRTCGRKNWNLKVQVFGAKKLKKVVLWRPVFQQYKYRLIHIQLNVKKVVSISVINYKSKKTIVGMYQVTSIKTAIGVVLVHKLLMLVLFMTEVQKNSKKVVQMRKFLKVKKMKNTLITFTIDLREDLGQFTHLISKLIVMITSQI